MLVNPLVDVYFGGLPPPAALDAGASTDDPPLLPPKHHANEQPPQGNTRRGDALQADAPQSDFQDDAPQNEQVLQGDVHTHFSLHQALHACTCVTAGFSQSTCCYHMDWTCCCDAAAQLLRVLPVQDIHLACCMLRDMLCLQCSSSETLVA